MDDLICKQTLFRLVCYLPWNQTPQKNRFILDQWISVIRHRRLIYFCGLHFFIFFVRQKCSLYDEQVDNHRKLLQTFRYGICQFANAPVCLSAHHLSLARMGSQTQTPCYAIDLPDCNAVLTNYRITPVCHATAVKFHSLPTLHNDGSTIHILEL